MVVVVFTGENGGGNGGHCGGDEGVHQEETLETMVVVIPIENRKDW